MDYIWTNPENIIEERNITQFPVYIDKNNKMKYVIDIDILEDWTTMNLKQKFDRK